MAEATSDLSVAERLARLLDGGLLPAGGPAEAAERLIERLERPARVALLGLPGAGKSSILNLLAGTVVVPETLRLPTIVVQHGAVARMLCTLADGRVEAVAGSDLAQVLTRNPALVTLELALPALKVISLLEVSAGPIETEQRRAAAWASKRADILIWCTTSYLPKEAQVWEAMPDGIKDNGFLFLTKIDLLGGKEAAAGLLDRVEQRAGDEFRQVLAISARQARAAMPPGGPVDREMFRDSGAAAVIGAIKSRVQAARRADMDTAELLLARHVEAGGIVARRFAEAAPGDLAPTGPGPEWTPPPEMGADAAVSTRPVMPDLPEATRPPGATEPPPAAPRRDPDPLVAQPPEPRPEPEPAVEPDPVAASEAGPAAGTAAEPSDAAALTGGNKRLSERLKESPAFGAAASAPQMPLRTTWRSRAETRAIPGAPAGPEPAPCLLYTSPSPRDS